MRNLVIGSALVSERVNAPDHFPVSRQGRHGVDGQCYHKLRDCTAAPNDTDRGFVALASSQDDLIDQHRKSALR